MAELFKVLAPQAAMERFNQHFLPSVRPQRLATAEALGRVLAAPIVSPQDLPEFARATVDGYAVLAADTYGATPGLPALLTVVGEVAMGTPATVAVGMGEAVLVHTGGMIPPGSDGVVMVEQTQRVDDQNIEVLKPVAVGENVLQVGEDVRLGDLLLEAGHTMRPQDIGGLLALGILEVEVAARPRVAILSTGDEVVPPDQQPTMGQVRDVNSYALAAQVLAAGGQPIVMGIAPDDRDAVARMASDAFAQADMVLFSAGSSVSYRDMTAEVIQALGEPGVLVHGVSIKPGKPTILAVCSQKPVFGLPGNPVSAMVIFDLFVKPTIRHMMGAAEAVVLGAKAGVDPNVIWQAVKASSGGSFVWESGTRAILRDKLAPTFTIDLARKDIGLATQLAKEFDVPLTMGGAAERLIDNYQKNGYAKEDVLATVKELEKLAGVTVRGTWKGE
jgi:molybdopterin molybdotransferase